MSEAPIGIFDSGLGGLSIMKAVRARLPAEDLIYIGDCQYAPYGDKDTAYIVERVFAIADELLSKGVKAIVIACNTATAAAADPLRARVEIPVIGVEPAVKPAAAQSRKGTVGVLATTSTLQSRRYASLLERFASHRASVISVPCPGLMECVESGRWDSPETLELIAKLTEPLRRFEVDTVVLGCTHYPFLKPQIAQALPAGCELIDPSEAVARHLAHQLQAFGLTRPDSSHPGQEAFFVTGEATKHSPVFERLWGKAVPVASL